MIKIHQFEQKFYKSLPKKPSCSFEKGTGTLIRSKRHAIQFPLIQVNHIHAVQYLIFDIDAPDAYLHFLDENLPTPNWISKNKKNGHCHICYALKTSVCKTENARMKPLRYLSAIEYSYAKRLKADLNYIGFLTKNPLHEDWETTFLTDFEYELDELADYVDLETKPKSSNREVSGLGRNCALFDTVRYWAYKAIREHLSLGFDGWYTEVLKQAKNANGEFLKPLPYSEVKAIVKSVARWVWRNHSEAHAKFIERQSIKGKVGASVANANGACNLGGKVRSQKYSDIRQEALKLQLQGITVTQIANQLGISRPSVYAYLKSVKVPS